MKVPLAKDYPDHHDADLVLRVYDLRRETLLREARKVVTTEFWPQSIDDFRAASAWDHPVNTPLRQVVGYWEMVFAMGRHGIVHAEYLAESSGGEAIILLIKLHPFLAEIRSTAGPRFLRNTEWMATETEIGREVYARLTPTIEAERERRRAAG